MKPSQAYWEVWGWTRQYLQPSHIADLLGKAEEERAERARVQAVNVGLGVGKR